jgi:hypothetical protein
VVSNNSASASAGNYGRGKATEKRFPACASLLLKREKGKMKILSILLTVLLLLGTALLFADCNNADVESALADAASGATSVEVTAEAQFGANDSRVEKIKIIRDILIRLRDDYPNAVTPDQQLTLLPTLRTAIDLFEQDVLPLVHASPAFVVAVAAIDAALRIAANHFVTVATKANAAKIARTAGKVKVAQSIDEDLAHLKAFLATPKVKK